jgi:hypothetical protein
MVAPSAGEASAKDAGGAPDGVAAGRHEAAARSAAARRG